MTDHQPFRVTFFAPDRPVDGGTVFVKPGTAQLAETAGHAFTLELRPAHLTHPPLVRYRWRCSCGDDGDWRPQSSDEAYLRWGLHAAGARS